MRTIGFNKTLVKTVLLSGLTMLSLAGNSCAKSYTLKDNTDSPAISGYKADKNTSDANAITDTLIEIIPTKPCISESVPINNNITESISSITPVPIDTTAIDTDINSECNTILVDNSLNLEFDKTTGVAILMLHKVLDDNAEITYPGLQITTSRLKELLEYIKNNGYTTVSSAQVNDFFMSQTPLPEKPVLIVFDDSFNINPAIDLLKEYNMHADIAVITNASEHGTARTPFNPYSWDELENLSADLDGDYIDLISHTNDHTYFKTGTTKEVILDEFKTSYDKIFEHTGNYSTTIVYPGGYFKECKQDIMDAGKEVGYTIGMVIGDRLNYYGITNPLALYRYEVNQNVPPEELFARIEKDRKKDWEKYFENQK